MKFEIFLSKILAVVSYGCETWFLILKKEHRLWEWKIHDELDIRFEVLTAVKMPMLVIWVLMQCGLVGGYHCFVGTYCLHLQHTYKSTWHHIPYLILLGWSNQGGWDGQKYSPHGTWEMFTKFKSEIVKE
jgi:hypothetical protein